MKGKKISLSSHSSLQELLQDITNMSYMQLYEIEECVNGLRNSTRLSEEGMEGKTKYAKALHDFMTDKDRVYKVLLDVSKVMNEVLKKGSEAEAVKGLGGKNGVQLSGGIDVNEIRKAVENMRDSGGVEKKTYNIRGVS